MVILDGLLAGLREVCSGFPDKRKTDAGIYTMADIGLSAFSLFFMQSESFLGHQRSLEEGRKTSNCHSLFGMAKIPTDNHIRSMLDPVHPSHLQPCFDQVLAQMKAGGGLESFERLAIGGKSPRLLIALDGTQYYCSQKLGCDQCLTRKRANGKVESYHSMLAATIVAPGHNMVLPLMPEFVARQDGAEKQDCERNAAKRWLATTANGSGRCARSILATTCSPASRSARRCWRRAATSCSRPSRIRTRPFTTSCKAPRSRSFAPPARRGRKN